MSGALLSKVDGTQVPVYVSVGEIVFGTDVDYTGTISYDLPSFLAALERLGFVVIPTEPANPALYDLATLAAVEQLVRDRSKGMATYQLGEARALRNTADAIRALRGTH